MAKPIIFSLYGETHDTADFFGPLSGVVEEITYSVTKLMLEGLKKLLENTEIKENLDAASPYVYTTGFLVFSGKPVNKETITNVLGAVGIAPNEKILNIMLSANVRNHVICLYAVYLLLTMGKEVNKNNLFAVIKAINEPVDEVAVEETMNLYMKKLIP